MKDNPLAVIVQESGLKPSKAQYILERFQDVFDIVSEWEVKAKGIVVTDDSQKEEMEKAREGRLILQKKRTSIEASRVELKADVLNEGRVIDGIAKTLTGLIKPIEEYLEKQEKFVENKAKEEQEARQREIMRRMHEEDLERSRLEGERQAKLEEDNEKLRVETERLKKEAEKREWEAGAAQREADRLLAVEKARAEAALKAEQEKAQKEREELELKARQEKEKAEREKKELEARLASQIVCPACGHVFTPEKIAVA